MSKRGVVLSADRALRNLREEDCKLLVRVDGFRLVGVVSKIRREYDSQVGRDRLWAMGLSAEDGKLLEEPLDRKNPKTGKLESVVVRETPFMYLTARKTPDPKDDDNNFNWLPYQFHMDMLKELEDELIAQQRIMNRLDEEYRSLQSKMDIIRRDAKVNADENSNLKTTVDYQSRKLAQLERENTEMYTLLNKLRGHGLEVEGELAVELKTALDRGREKAMSPHEIRVKKLQEDEEEKRMVEQTIARKETTSFDIDDIRDVIRDEVRKANNQSTKVKPASGEELLSSVQPQQK